MAVNVLKVHLQTFLSIPITQKCQILSCDTLVANEPYAVHYLLVHHIIFTSKEGGHVNAEGWL